MRAFWVLALIGCSSAALGGPGVLTNAARAGVATAGIASRNGEHAGPALRCRTQSGGELTFHGTQAEAETRCAIETHAGCECARAAEPAYRCRDSRGEHVVRAPTELDAIARCGRSCACQPLPDGA